MSTDSSTTDELNLEIPSIEEIQEILPESMEDQSWDLDAIDSQARQQQDQETPEEKEELAPEEILEAEAEESAEEATNSEMLEEVSDEAEANLNAENNDEGEHSPELTVEQDEEQNEENDLQEEAAADQPEDHLEQQEATGEGESLDSEYGKVFERAQEAFEESEFNTVATLLAEIPKHERNEEVERLKARAQGMLEYEENWRTAKWCVEEEDFVSAVEYLEKIPEEIHTIKISTMLQIARSQAAVQITMEEAKEHLTNYDFDQAIELFESIPEDKISDSCKRLMTKTKQKKEKYEELKKEGSAKYQDAIINLTSEDSSAESFKAVQDIYEEVLVLCPVDEEAKDRVDKADRYVTLNEEKMEFLQVGDRLIEMKEYEKAFRTYKKIDTDVLTESIREKINNTELIILQIEEIAEGIKDSFEQGMFKKTLPKFQKLSELSPRQVDLVLADLLKEGVGKNLSKLINTANENPGLIELLDFFVGAINANDFELFLNTDDASILNTFPENASSLYEKLVHVLSSLTEQPELFHQRIQILQQQRRHLKTAEANLAAWEEFLEMLTQFDQLQSERWSLIDRFVENERINKLERLAQRVAETSDNALPQGEERWERLVTIAEGKLEYSNRMSQILYKKIAEYLETGVWCTSPLSMVSKEKATKIATYSCATVLVIEFWLIISRVWSYGTFNSTVIVLPILLATWAGFCMLARKLVEKYEKITSSESEENPYEDLTNPDSNLFGSSLNSSNLSDE